nr:hypothetical protein [Allomuricauda sp.]
MSTLAIIGVLVAAISGITSNLKDLKNNDSWSVKKWLEVNRYLVALIFLSSLGGVIGWFGVFSQKSESEAQKLIIENLREQNDKILALSLLERKSNPKIYLFTRKSDIQHSRNLMWKEKQQSDSLAKTSDKQRAIGFFSSNVRSVFFQDDVSTSKFDSFAFGHLSFTIDKYITDQLLVSSSGFVSTTGGMLHSVKSINTYVENESDTLALNFEFHNPIQWGNVLASLRTKYDNGSAVITVRRQNPNNEVSEITFDHLQMTFILSEYPPVRITSELVVKNLKSNKDFYSYDLVLKQKPRILVE